MKTTTSEKDDLHSGNTEDGPSSKKIKLVETDINASFSNSKIILEPAPDLAKQRIEKKQAGAELCQAKHSLS